MAAYVMLNAAGDGSSAGFRIPIVKRSIVFHAFIRGTTGTVSSTVKIYGSNDPVAAGAAPDLTTAAKEELASLTLSGTGVGLAAAAADSDKIEVTAPYTVFWAVVSSTTGTGAVTSVVASS